MLRPHPTHVTIEERTEGVFWLTLDRPPLNVLHIPMMEQLADAVSAVAEDRVAKAMVITGVGKAFSAGVDVGDHTPERVHDMLRLFHQIIRKLVTMETPVIAAVNGAALGGGWELAMACDLIIAREDARIGQPEIKLAAFPPVAVILLPRLIGWQRAMEMVLTGRVLTAVEAERWGLVNRVLPAAAFEASVGELAGQLAALSQPAVRLTKRAALLAAGQPFDQALELAEDVYLRDLITLDDALEGLAAFMEKRPPVWRNR